MGKTVRVRTHNKRIFVGKLVSVDFRCNVILVDAIAEIIPEYNTPLNYTLDNSADSKMKFEPDASLSP